MKTEHGGDWLPFQTEYGTAPLDFSANVSPLGMPEGALRAAAEALKNASRYPDPFCRTLCAALSAKTGVPAENIVCGNGAADLIWRLPAALHAKKALLPIPAFSEYAAALRAHGCTVGTFALSQEEAFLLPPSFPNAIDESIDLVLLCQPNNPTGRLIPFELLKKILHRCNGLGAVLVVDECFLDLTSDPEAHTLLRSFGQARVILLRAFTKTYGMAGLRLGYALCSHRADADALRRCAQPWPVSSCAEAAGVAALADEAYLARLRALMAEERPFMQAMLAGLGMRVIPGEANFLLFYCEDALLDVYLRKKGILLRSCSNFPGLGKGWYRTAIRTRAENCALLQALRERQE